MNKNYNVTLNIKYVRQQEAVKEVCKELNLVVFYPNYHGDKQDDNTVMIYTKEAHEYNKTLPDWTNTNQYKPSVCFLENTDITGNFSLDWLKRGRIDCRGLDEKQRIKDYIIKCFEEYKSKNI